MNKLPGPYDNGPEYEGLISRFVKQLKAKREVNKRAIARRKEIESVLRDCRLGLLTPNQVRELYGMKPEPDFLKKDFVFPDTHE